MRLLFFSLVLSALGSCLGQSNGPSQTSDHGGQLSGTISVPLTNHKYMVYTIPLKIGTPAQEFDVMLDTTGPTWLPAFDCTETTESCSGRKKFKGIDSTSYSVEERGDQPVFQKFDRGNVTGPLSRDVHELGGVDIGQHYFINAGKLRGVPSYEQYSFDGVLGLHQAPHSILKEMAQTGVIAKPWLGLYFSSDENATGEALFGGDNGHHYEGSLSFVDAEETSYKFRITRIDYPGFSQNYPEGRGSSGAILSPSEQYILGPWNEIRSINEWLGGRMIRDGRYEFFCGYPSDNVVFTIASKRFVLRPEDYVIKVDTPTGAKCYSAFDSRYRYATGDPSWQLGLPFLRRAYTVLEASLQSGAAGRVGFANVRSR